MLWQVLNFRNQQKEFSHYFLRVRVPEILLNALKECLSMAVDAAHHQLWDLVPSFGLSQYLLSTDGMKAISGYSKVCRTPASVKTVQMPAFRTADEDKTHDLLSAILNCCCGRKLPVYGKTSGLKTHHRFRPSKALMTMTRPGRAETECQLQPCGGKNATFSSIIYLRRVRRRSMKRETKSR